MIKTIFRKIVLEVELIFLFSPIRLHGEGGVYDLYCSQPPEGDQRASSFTFKDEWDTPEPATATCKVSILETVSVSTYKLLQW